MLSFVKFDGSPSLGVSALLSRGSLAVGKVQELQGPGLLESGKRKARKTPSDKGNWRTEK